MRSRNAIIKESVKLALVDMSIYLPIIGLVVIVFATWSLRHLTVLNKELLARSATDLMPISPQPLPNEFQPLVNGFNDLLQRLDAARMREQRFLADAAHELRTPLATLRVQAQIAMRVIKDEDRRAALGALVQGIDRTTRITEQLLAVSRIDGASTGDLAMEIIQLDVAVEAVFAELKPLAELRGISLRAHVQGQALTTVDWMLNVAIRNLVDNAIRHCPTGAVVSVTCRQADHGLEVIVSDTGPGIEAVHRTQLGKRFFRVPGTTTNGSGLGFSIVVAICERLDATLRIDPHLLDGTGLRVTIIFPYITIGLRHSSSNNFS